MIILQSLRSIDKMKKKLLLTTAGLLSATLALNSCTTAAVATTGLVLAGTALAIGAYKWMQNPDAYNAYEKSADTVYTAAQDVLKESKYTITSQSTDEKKSEVKATSPSGSAITIVVKKDNADQSEIFIKDDSKATATIILNKINSALDAEQASYDKNSEAK
ncbi:DUF3568 family protein [Francisella sp. Scap27]|uniref:DUF3568 family protein n=2 Tax=Francisellaceae TaxID=34064 RepID=A0A2Z4XW81_9GAMM|nr:hypothetical protein CDH04_01100 [Francisella adeliensis]QIW11327.1 DUF3568 family protein [Francisella adeliensis]QIW13201.1 DUF3568 family protein [Francisella adeliensis]QLE79106.1 DUF3568 family protein [Francisella sp. Scap27]